MQFDFYLSLGNSVKGPNVSVILARACVCVCVCGRARSEHDSRQSPFTLRMYFKRIAAGSAHVAQYLICP